jgi:hypothetical protein
MELAQFCYELNNWFDVSRIFGVFSIEDSKIYCKEDFSAVPVKRDTVIYDLTQDGQYFRIIGSVFNDGIYQAPDAALTDEIFEGAVWLMAIPKAAFDLFERIKEWDEKNSAVTESPYTSESFGGYSYTRATGANSEPLSWQSQFKRELNAFRKFRA